MAVVENRFVCDLSKPVQAQALKGNVFSLDNLGSRLSVLIYNNGQPATISGSVTANCILPDGSTVNVNGGLTTENGSSKAYVDIPQSCLLIHGILKIAIKCTSSSVITTLAAIVANVYMTKTDNVITPSQQIINDWNAEISAAIATQNAAIANQDTKINDLKSALVNVQDGFYLLTGYTTTENEVPNTSGTFDPQPNWLRTDYIEVEAGKPIYFNNPTRASSDNVWYYSDKSYEAKFTVTTGDLVEVTPPSGAKYMIASNAKAAFYTAIYMDNSIVKNIESDIDTINNNLGEVNSLTNAGYKYLMLGEPIENEVPNTSGTFDPQPNWLRTDYIEVEEGDKVYFNNPTRASSDNVWYYSDKSYEAKFTVSIGESVEVTVPSGAKYMVASNAKAAFYTEIYTNSNVKKTIEANMAEVNSRLEKTNTAISYANDGKEYLLNCNYVENEVPNTSGTFDPQPNWLRTDYIEVKEGKPIYFTNPTRASSDNVWYYSDKSYEAKFTVTTGENISVTPPTGAKYMVLSNAKAAFYTTVYAINDYETQIELNKAAIKKRNKVIDFLQKDKLGEKYWEQYEYTSYTISAAAKHEVDITRAIYSEGSIRCKMPNSNIMDIRLTKTTAVNLIGISVVEVIVYIEDKSKITQINLQILPTNFSRTIANTDLVNGWNRLRYYTFDGDTSIWDTGSAIRLNVYGDENKEIWIDSVRFLRRPKGIMFFVEDGGYTSFYQIAQPAFDALGVPVTWAIDPGILGTPSYNMSLEDMEDVMQNGNAEFSFHSYEGERTALMTASELIADTENALRWLSKNGLLPKYYWRAAFTQNDAPEYLATADIIPVLATHDSKVGLDSFPFSNPLNVPRTAIHNRSTDDIDAYFEKIQKTHCFICFYTHGIQDDYETNCSIAKWEHFLSKLTTAINGGWLLPTTYNRLMTSGDY